MGAVRVCDIEEVMSGNQAGNERREKVSDSDPSEMTGVCRGRGCEGEGGDKPEGGGKDTYRMISGGSCCQDLLDNLPLCWEVGGDV